MKKLVMTDYHQLTLQEAPIPVPGPEEAVVRVVYAGICGSDLHIIAGQHPTAKPPFVMGHEMCGVIHSINSRKKSFFTVGQKVAVHAVKGCGVCKMCRTGRENLCPDIEIMGAGCDGFFSEYIVCPINRLIAFRDEVDMEVAALVEPLTIGVHDVLRSQLQPGDDVFIVGAGPIGLIIGLVARLYGARNIMFGEINETRIAMAEKFGFSAVNTMASDWETQCQQVVAGGKFDKIFEVTGVQGGFETGLTRLKQGGTMVQVGMPASGRFEGGFNVNAIIFNEASYMGVRNSSAYSMSLAANIINDGCLDTALRQLISAIYPKEEAIGAFQRAKSDLSVLKVLIAFA